MAYTLHDKVNLVKVLCLQKKIICRKAQIDQLIEGLNEFGLIENILKRDTRCFSKPIIQF